MANTDLKNLIIAYRNIGLAYKEIAKKTGVSSEYARTVCSRSKRTSVKKEQLKPNGVCKCCGKQLDMTGVKRNRLFCDTKCRNDFNNHIYGHMPYICVCEFCGHEFVAYGNPRKRFCSRECQTLAGRKG